MKHPVVVKLVVTGCEEYLVNTLYWWLLEIEDLIEEECGIDIVPEKAMESECTRPYPVRLYANEELVMEGLPGEEGYLIEALKKLIKECR
ncbi:MAG: hypothetical protein F7C07_00035 [Desulfurococcales archaeon]|nr:hypothetical protein [Desulfurococcales archaeon]